MKSRKTYTILTLCGILWLLPVNRWYLGEAAIGRAITLNWFAIGALIDMLNISKHYEESITRRGYVNTSQRG